MVCLRVFAGMSADWRLLIRFLGGGNYRGCRGTGGYGSVLKIANLQKEWDGERDSRSCFYTIAHASLCK